jgi:putative membrane protein
MEKSMLIRWLLAAVHLLGYGFALAAIIGRTRGLRRLRSPADLPRVFLADNVWGITAVILIVTGLMRVFGGFEKGADYYLHEPLFHLKMAALVLILIFEIAPMMSLIRWRIAVRNGETPDIARAGRFARIGHWQSILLVVMVFAASGMARGIGAGAS